MRLELICIYFFIILIIIIIIIIVIIIILVRNRDMSWPEEMSSLANNRSLREKLNLGRYLHAVEKVSGRSMLHLRGV